MDGDYVDPSIYNPDYAGADGFDVAFVLVSTYSSSDVTPCVMTTLGCSPVLGYRDPAIGEEVCKTGVNTTVTCGRIDIYHYAWPVVAPKTGEVTVYAHLYEFRLEEENPLIRAGGQGDSGGLVWYWWSESNPSEGVVLFGIVTAGSKYAVVFTGIGVLEYLQLTPLLHEG